VASDDHERPYAVLVKDDEGERVLCNECAYVYLGEAEMQELAQENVGDTLLCGECNADLANPEEVGHDE